LVDQLEGLAAEQPVLVTYEDVHWSDATTQELLGLTIERIPSLPVLVLITCRPEFRPPWTGQPHMSALALTRLGRREGAAMVDQVVGDKALPDEVAAQIVAKTDGVPLFVEELTKTVLESGLLRDAATAGSSPARCRRSPSRRRCTTPCSRASIAWPLSRRWPRSAPR
jgi:predicted ATPase